MQPSLKKLLDYNETIRQNIYILECQLESEIKKLKAPCADCRIDSDFRCDTCRANHYTDFEYSKQE